MRMDKKTGRKPNIYEGQRFWGYIRGYRKLATPEKPYRTSVTAFFSIPVGDQ